MDKWVMQVVLVLLVLAAAMGLKSFATQACDGSISVSSSPAVMAPTSAPMPIPFGRGVSAPTSAPMPIPFGR